MNSMVDSGDPTRELDATTRARERDGHDRRYAASKRRYIGACIALLVLLAATAAIARVHLGIGNLAASLGIALVKALIVGWVFMSLREASGLTRLIAVVGVVALLIMGSLGLADFVPRRGDEPVRYQQPQRVRPTLAQGHDAPQERRDPGDARQAESRDNRKP